MASPTLPDRFVAGVNGTNPYRPPCSGRVDDASTLGDLHLSGNNESSCSAPRRLHQCAPVVRADLPCGLTWAGRHPGGSARE